MARLFIFGSIINFFYGIHLFETQFSFGCNSGLSAPHFDSSHLSINQIPQWFSQEYLNKKYDFAATICSILRTRLIRKVEAFESAFICRIELVLLQFISKLPICSLQQDICK